MSFKNYSFSKFTHVYEKGNVAAVFHSLKMKPLFMEREIFQNLKNIVACDKSLTEPDIKSLTSGDKMLSAIDLFLENRVLNETKDRDKEVVEFFRESIATQHIKIAYFILAETCNLSCSYCFERCSNTNKKNKNTNPSIMDKETALKSLDFFEKMLSLYPSEKEEKDIIFYGGEPLLNYKVLVYILEEIHTRKSLGNPLWNNVRLSIVTNGTLLTDEIVKKLNSLNLSIGISIDGPKEVTDKNRYNHKKESIFNEILHGINNCKNNGVDYSLSVTLSEEAVENFNSVVKYIKGIKPSSLGFNLLMTNEEYTANQSYNKKAANFLISAFEEFRKDGLYEDRMMRKVNAFVNSEVYPFDCGATGGNQLVFSPAGQVGICHGYLENKKYFPTNVNEKEFIPSSNDVFIEWSKRSPLNMEQCQSCEALGICGGGCPMNAERNHGSIWDLDDRFCVHAKKTLEWLIWDLYSKLDQ